MAKHIEFTITQTGYTITARLTRETSDLLIEIIGGDVPHYGVVTTIQPDGTMQSIALPSRPGHHHQERVLTERIAQIILPVLTGNAVIVSGMHVNNITPEQMRAAVPMTKNLGTQIVAWLQANPPQKEKVTYTKRTS